MGNGRQNVLSKQVGENLVCAELARRGFISTTFAGHVPNYDIVAVAPDQEAVFVQVKASRKGDWQLNAKTFLDIEVKDGVQTILGKKDLPDTIWVFVRIESYGKDRFFIMGSKALQDSVYRNYDASLQKLGGRRRNPETTHAVRKLKELEPFENKWDLIEE